MAEDSDLEKTEPASERRKQQAREEGQVPQSRELATFLVLMAGLGSLWAASGWFSERISALVRRGLTLERREAMDAGALMHSLSAASGDALAALAPLFLVLVVAAVVAPAFVGGFNLAPKALQPDFSRLDPLEGVKRIFSAQGLVELLKGVLKALLIGLTAGAMLWSQRGEMLGLISEPLEAGLPHFARLLLWTSLVVVASLALVAIIDVPFQLWQYERRLRMSKQELRQEAKEQEGDPKIKQQIRARGRELARRRMMAEVPKADVVVTNPTHYAVALKYDAASMAAPTVVAKGSDLLAARIRELAREHGVALLEAPPLARALFRHAEVGDQVPAALYTAVAEVLAYVYQLNHYLAQGGLPPSVPADLPVPTGLDPGATAGA